MNSFCGFLLLSWLCVQAPEFNTVGYPMDHLEALWQRRVQALAHGDFSGASTLLQTLSMAKHRAGYPDLPAMGEVLALESRNAGAAGDARRGLELATYAVDLAPHRLAPRMSMVAAHWATGDLKGSFAELYSALALSWSEPPILWMRLGNMTLLAAFAALGACLAFSLAALYRQTSAVEHELQRHLLPAGATRRQCWLLAAVPLLLPALLHLGAAWVALVWLALLAPFLRGEERAGALGAVGVLFVIALMLPVLTLHLGYAGSRAEVLYQVMRSADVDDALENLKHRDDLRPVEFYALGLRARWEGKLKESRAQLEKAIQGGLIFPELYMTLGNVEFLDGDATAALKIYDRLLTSEPNHVFALYNLSQIYANSADPRGTDLRKKANDLNFRTVAKLIQWTERTGLPVVDPEVPRAILAAARPEGDATGDPHANAVAQMWRSIGGPIPRLLFLPAALLVLGWLWWAGGRGAGRWSHVCTRCGDASCGRCQPGLDGLTALCANCHLVFTEGARSQQQTRIQKEIDSHRYRARLLATQRVFNVVLAGAGQLLRGQSVRGLILATLFLTTLLALGMGVGLLPEPYANYTGSSGVFNVFGGLFLAGVYTLALLDGQREQR